MTPTKELKKRAREALAEKMGSRDPGVCCIDHFKFWKRMDFQRIVSGKF